MHRGRAAALIVASVLVICVPLAATSIRISRAQATQSEVTDLADEWAHGTGWEIAAVTDNADRFLIRATGPLPEPETASLQSAINNADLGDTKVSIELIPSRIVSLKGEPETAPGNPVTGTDTTLD